jgi:hypothetical protein
LIDAKLRFGQNPRLPDCGLARKSLPRFPTVTCASSICAPGSAARLLIVAQPGRELGELARKKHFGIN